MLQLVLIFAAAAGVIVVAGSFLARFADAIGERTGMGRSLAGMVLLATATSLPELAFGCNAAHMGAIDLAVGDLVGASLINLLVLAVLDLTHRQRGLMFSKMAAAHALSAQTCVLLVAIVLLVILTRPTAVWLGAGVGTWAIIACYLLCIRLVFFDQRYAAALIATSGGPGPGAVPVMTLPKAALGFLACAAAIFFTAPWLAYAAEEIAHRTGLGGTFVGTTLVAASTALPEMVSSLTAVRMKAFDLAAGNVFGSNAFNLAILLPVDLCYSGSLLLDCSPTHAVTAAALIIVTSVATLGLLYRAEKRYWFVEPDAALVILLVTGALYIVFRMR